MKEAPHSWCARGLRSSLEPLLPGVAVEVVERVESTNAVLVDRVRLYTGHRPGSSAPVATAEAPAAHLPAHGRRSADTHQPWLLVAEHQTHGRTGQAAPSGPGASLTFSLSLPLSPRDWSGLTQAIAVALAEALDPESQGTLPRILLKWPNNLWLRDPAAAQGARTLGGVSIETVPAGGRRVCVVGVSLNVRSPWPDADGTGHAWLAELDPEATPPWALSRVAVPLARALLTFQAGGFARFAERFAARDALAGRRVVTMPRNDAVGIAEGVDGSGALRLLCDDGRRLVVTSGGVHLRLPATRSGSGLAADGLSAGRRRPDRAGDT